MKFGFENRRQLTGADLYVRIFQVASLLPALYILILPGYPGIVTHRSVLSALFDLGFSALPRTETLLLSLLYRRTGSEILMFFALLLAALMFGILSKRLLARTPRATRLVCALLICADFALRLLPLRVNTAFGQPYSAIGFAVRVLCLALIAMDLNAAKQSS